MKDKAFEESNDINDELQAEYQLDYRKAKPNRFVARNVEQQLKVVVLDDDVAQVFRTPESVNNVLRALIDTMPQSVEN
ncbi:hypothetical protein [Acaryochloris marina]|uniref:hypothetical protein n=1 Tax=Acaryochloris marina TaxID=155978 RepID=UPI001BB0991B|nr:hypothetical protein [Acaryochloris marina]QUY44049.1 hypothetical protein I1H34_08120 [Acaryochloris marina S15]